MCAVLLLFAIPSSSAAIFPFEVNSAKKKDGPYTSDIKKVNVKKGKKKILFFQVKSISDFTLAMTFDDANSTDSSADISYKWFKGKKQRKNISSAVKGGGLGFNLKPGKKKTFNLVVNVKTANAADCVSGRASDDSSSTSLFAAFGINGVCT